MTQPAQITLIRDTDNPWFEVVLTEGKNREIRKMFEEIGHFVEKVRRVGFGPLVLDVPPGETRELNEAEVTQLKRAARKKAAPLEQSRARRPRSGPATLPRLPAVGPARKRVLSRGRARRP
jgi:23S rRNA pseudouridine2605 synthase